ncbi:hypothetical protein LX16_2809 [Stackebrandtia albiflava]|uniref:Uncharacterized protein n=1 Tax=Stackebrandtia albiflava TaxID=406432 RepID=A0A562V2G3_9ACTN|nr:hypothetical protein [Stackebrandtia albiflava]TWJ12061.1 hypothetical protein LX16_2809 [Stackebrandtia albiflava]
MKLINRIADRALERLAPQTTAAADTCWWAVCSENCWKRCCTSTGCSKVCVCI